MTQLEATQYHIQIFHPELNLFYTTQNDDHSYKVFSCIKSSLSPWASQNNTCLLGVWMALGVFSVSDRLILEGYNNTSVCGSEEPLDNL